MANNYMGNMTFGVNFKVDTKALDQLDTQFGKIEQNLEKLGKQASAKGNTGLKAQIDQASKSAELLYQSLSKSYNMKLGQFDISKLNAELANAKTNLSNISADLGAAGQNVNTIFSSLLNSKVTVKETNKFLDKMAITFGNTVRWSITTKFLNTITGAVQKAFYFTKDLDRSLNEIRVVTGKSADEMERFAKQATNAAQALGKTTTDYTKASLLFYQQGLSDKEVQARTETTLKAANVTGQSTSQVSEQLTAVWNGYRVTAEETEKYVDKLSAVAASTASNLEELSTGMSKVASAANMMGVDVDQLNAQLSTVISVTRQAPETIGAAFKTIYSRMSTIKAGGIDEEDGATLTSYSEKMNNFGISVLDTNGKLRDMGEVIEEIGNKWETLTREQQIGLAQAMGGTRQYSNLTALFENWDKYQAALKTSQQATGTLQKQQDIYMDSLDAHFKQLTAEAEKFYEAILDEDAIKSLTDGLRFIVQEINMFIKSIGGGGAAITAFGATVMNLFSNQLGKSFGTFLNNRAAQKQESARLAAYEKYVDQVRNGEVVTVNTSQGKISTSQQAQGVSINEVRASTREDKVVMSAQTLKEQAENEREILQIGKSLGNEKMRQLSQENEEVALLKAKVETYEAVERSLKRQGKEASEIVTEYKESEVFIEKCENKLQKLEETEKKITKNIQEQTKARNEAQTKLTQYQQDTQKKINANNIQQQFFNNKDATSKFMALGGNIQDTMFNKNGSRKASGSVEANALKAYYQDALKYYDSIEKKNKSQLDVQNKITQAINNQLKGYDANNTLVKEIEAERTKAQSSIIINQDEINKKEQEYTKEIEKADKNIQKLNSDLADTKTKTSDITKEQNAAQKFVDDKGSIINLARDMADGTSDRIKNEANQRAAALAMQLGNDKRIVTAQKVIQGITGAARAGTALVGGLTTALDKNNDALTRANGLWEGITGTLTGSLSIINPALGFAASAVTGLVKSIFDATGITKELGELFKTDTERIEDSRQAMLDATDALRQMNQEASQHKNLEAQYQEQKQTLIEIKNTWDKIIAKQNAGLTLTLQEKEDYQKIKNQLIEMNDSIILGYDEQGEAIIDNLGSLRLITEELERQLKIQQKINGQDTASLVEKYNNALESQEKYENDVKNFTNTEGYQDAKTAFEHLSKASQFGQLFDITRYMYDDESGHSVKKLMLKDSKSSDMQQLKDTDYDSWRTITEFFGEEAKNFEDLFANITEEEVNAIEKAFNNADDKLKGYGDWADDANDVAKPLIDALRMMATWNSKKDTTDLAQVLSEAEQTFVQDFKRDFQYQTASQAKTSFISNIAMQQGSNTYSQRITSAKESGIRFTPEDLENWKTESLNETKTYLEKLNQYSDELDKAALQVASLESRKAEMTIKDVLNERQRIFDSLDESLQSDENVVNALLGADPLAYINEQLKEYEENGDDKNSEEVNKLLDYLSNTDKVLGKDIDKFLAFVKSNQDYSEYGEDFYSQFMGFKHDNYGTALFNEAVPEMITTLNEIKNLSLDGSVLDEEKFEVLNSQLKEYNGDLANLETEVAIITDKELYGTQVWYESLKRVEKELQAIQEKTLFDERKVIIETEIDNTAAKMQIDELVNADYKILADIELQGTDAFDSAVKEVQNLQTALGYIGEEGIVATENIQELISAFPELANSATILSDGTLKLTEDQIELIQKRTDADIKGTIAARETELKAQLQRVEQEKERIKAQIELVDTYLNAEKAQYEDREGFEKKFLEIYSDYEDTKTDVSLQGDIDIENSSWKTANAVTDYWIEAYKEAANANDQFVQSVINGNKVLSGEMDPSKWQSTYNASNLLGDKKHDLTKETQKTGSQNLLDEAAKRHQDDDLEGYYKEIKAKLEAELQKADSDYALIQGYMLELEGLGAATVKNIGDLGKKTKEAAWAGKDLLDVYHDINKELEFINQKLTVLQKKEKLLKDDALLKNLQAQTVEYEKQIDALNEKRAIARGYAEEIRTRETTAEGNKGLSQYGLEFDAEGNITNYAEVAAKLQAGQNSKESVEDYENFNTQYKLYEEQLKTLRDLEGQLYDAVAKRQELQGKAIQAKIEMILDVSKAEKKYLEFTKKLGSFSVDLIINPDQTSVDAAAAQVATSFIKATAEALPEQNKLLKKGNKALNKLQNGTEPVKWNGHTYKQEDIYQLQEDTQKLASSIEQSTEDIQQAYQGTLDSYSNALKELNDWDKRVLAKYDMVNGVYDHAEKLTELWYGKDSLEAQLMLANYSKDKTNNLTEQAKEANEQVKRNWQEYQDALETGNAQLAEETYDMWADSIQNLQKLTEQWAEQRKKQLTDELAVAQKIVETQLFGGKTREEFIDSWDMINKKAEIYLDTINAQFGVTKLENKYLEAINKSIGNTKSQDKLTKIMNEELAMLKEKDKLTKYDLERAEAKYDLTLKQIALEEARDNKTNLRLRRDSQGNYTYQYTANQDDILKAQGEVDAAQNNLYNMDRDRMNDLTQQILDAEQEYSDKYKQICIDFADDAEERNRRLAQLDEDYFNPTSGILAGLLNEHQIAYSNLQESIDFTLNGQGQGTVLGSFEELKKNLSEQISTLAPAVNTAILPVIQAWIGDDKGEGGISGAYKTLEEDSEEFFEKYEKDVQDFADAIDQNDAFGKVRKTFNLTKKEVKNFRTAAEKATTAIGNLNQKGSEFSLETLYNSLTDVSNVFAGESDSNNGLINRIKQAQTDLEALVRPKKKVENLGKIKKALAEQKDTLEANDGAFKNSQTVVNTYYQTIIKQATEAERIAKQVKAAIDAIPTNKTVTITTVHVDKSDGSTGKTTGSSDVDKLYENGGTGAKDYNVVTLKNGKITSIQDELTSAEAMGFKSSSTNVNDGTQALSKDTKVYALETIKEDFGRPDTYVLKTYDLRNAPKKKKIYTSQEALLKDNGLAQAYWNGTDDLTFSTGYKEDRKVKYFNTGGYTGAWGDQGKLAMLHEKELVLNKDDTKNMLQMVDIIRQIDIGRLESNMLDTFFTMQQKLKDSSMAPDSQPAATNQNIIINADFPDATDRDEIKAAFDSIVNMASQRAFTKKY